MLKKLSNTFKVIIFIPLFIYFGKRSFIAFDEGYYILQAKWILSKGNWIAPLWFSDIALDRTIGIQFLIALSQKIFGKADFAIYLPITIASIFTAYLTYEIHKELIGDDFAIASPIILSTTFLWINYTNLATQDIIFSAIVSLGIFATIKASRNERNIFFLLSGVWIGLAIMLKTYLTIIPLIGILPFLSYKQFFQRRFFWYGLLLGLFPFFLWSLLILNNYGYSIYNGLFSKLISLSKNNNFTNPIYYYLWNIPINIFPWSILLIIGTVSASKITNNTAKYFLFYYPLIVIFLLSIFSTKTPYYPLQIYSLLAINSYLGILFIIQYTNRFIIFSKFFNFIFIPLLIFIFTILVKLNYVDIKIDSIEKNYLILGLTLFSVSWISYNFIRNNKLKVFCILLGPYLLFSSILQSGLITDRSKDLRIASQNLITLEKLQTTKMNTIISDIDNEFAFSKIIKIHVLMPKLVEGLNSLDELSLNDYAWTTLSKEEILLKKDLSIINKSEIFRPWNLVQKDK